MSVVILCSEKKETLDLGRVQCSLGSLVLTWSLMLRKGKGRKLSTSELATQSAGRIALSNGEKFAVQGRKGSSGGVGVGCQAGGRL